MMRGRRAPHVLRCGSPVTRCTLPFAPCPSPYCTRRSSSAAPQLSRVEEEEKAETNLEVLPEYSLLQPETPTTCVYAKQSALHALWRVSHNGRLSPPPHPPIPPRLPSPSFAHPRVLSSARSLRATAAPARFGPHPTSVLCLGRSTRTSCPKHPPSSTHFISSTPVHSSILSLSNTASPT